MSVRTPHRLADRYTLHGKIASGGMASVHFGRQLGVAGFARTVAIKRLHPHLADDPDFRSTLVDEARLAARIHHPNVVATLDIVASEGELLVVMEYVRGESFARLLRAEEARGQRIPLPIVGAVVSGALHGLGAAHGATGDRGEPLGLVHRDVSPQNVVVGVDGLARMIDFGVAKAAGRLQTTREGMVKGKIPYMAPEHLEGRRVSAAADIYAMGVVLWEALAGQRLFAGEDETQILVRVLTGATVPPSHFVPEITPELDAVAMKALARDPDERFATAEAMAEALVRACPPALAPVVGQWVSEVARGELDVQRQLLADIESESSHAAVPALPVASRAEETQDGAGVRADASSSRGRGQLAFALVLAAVAVVGSIAGALLTRSAARSTAAVVPAALDVTGASAASVAAPTDVTAARVAPTPTGQTAVADAAVPSGGTAYHPSTAPTMPNAPVVARPRPHGTPRQAASASIRFADPD